MSLSKERGVRKEKGGEAGEGRREGGEKWGKEGEEKEEKKKEGRRRRREGTLNPTPHDRQHEHYETFSNSFLLKSLILLYLL